MDDGQRTTDDGRPRMEDESRYPLENADEQDQAEDVEGLDAADCSQREHFCPDDTSHGEHEHGLDVQPDQDEKGGRAWLAPHRRVVGEMQDEAIPDFVEPVHPPEGQTGKDEIPIALFGFHDLHIEDESQQRDDIPLKVAAIPQDAEGLLGRFGGHSYSFELNTKVMKGHKGIICAHARAGNMDKKTPVGEDRLEGRITTCGSLAVA